MAGKYKAKVVAAKTPEELEQKLNEFLSQENIDVYVLNFAMDGTALSYNVIFLYE